MKLTKVKAVRAVVNEKWNAYIKKFQNYKPVDIKTGYDEARSEDMNFPFNPEPYPFELDNEGYLILDEHFFDYPEYEIEFQSFSHIEKKDKAYILTTLDGSQHSISKKEYKKLGKSKTK